MFFICLFIFMKFFLKMLYTIKRPIWIYIVIFLFSLRGWYPKEGLMWHWISIFQQITYISINYIVKNFFACFLTSLLDLLSSKFFFLLKNVYFSLIYFKKLARLTLYNFFFFFFFIFAYSYTVLYFRTRNIQSVTFYTNIKLYSGLTWFSFKISFYFSNSHRLIFSKRYFWHY